MTQQPEVILEKTDLPATTGLNTRCVHAARAADPTTGAVAQPIHLSTTFERDADGGYSRGYRYSREGAPNRAALESCVATLEGGVGALAFSSGLAANMAALELLQSGDHLVAPTQGYHGTLKQFRDLAGKRGVEVSFVDFTDPHHIESAAKPATRLIWAETPANPLLSITDLAAVSSIARRVGAWFLCDNTFATPVCQRPFDFGADLIVHSGTKYLGGHSDALSGLVVVREDMDLLQRLREWQSLAGAVLSPFDCWLLRRSIATLGIRVRTQCGNALALAQHFQGHDRVERIHYPGLPQNPGHALAVSQMTGGFGAVLSMCVAGGAEAAMRVAARTRLFTRATSLGGVESLIEHRASIEGPNSATPKNLLRLSIGIEDLPDLIDDLRQALE